ncbi:MAG: hypothetical protein M3069_19090, partial [Chloroflexota bacterium]|nr:hypothetical protein [Chloroflexota bacterium]
MLSQENMRADFDLKMTPGDSSGDAIAGTLNQLVPLRIGAHDGLGDMGPWSERVYLAGGLVPKVLRASRVRLGAVGILNLDGRG